MATCPSFARRTRRFLIGPASARESYLNADSIIEAAIRTGARAIHPRYGFLSSENAGFAERVAAAGLIWIGAPAAAIRAKGLKDAAKKRMIAVRGQVLARRQAISARTRRITGCGGSGCDRPSVLTAAVAGGGGKACGGSMALWTCSSTRQLPARSRCFFGDDRVLREIHPLAPPHRGSGLGDTHGNVVHLFERDCSLQRRHQKVIEEALGAGMDAPTREVVCQAVVQAARGRLCRRRNDRPIADASDGLRADRIWFMEMNTRLQVEHPVTEAISGQIWSNGKSWWHPEPLPRGEQLSIKRDGRWRRVLMPKTPPPASCLRPGGCTVCGFLDGVRVDSGVEEANEISAYYDPMIAKPDQPRRDATRGGTATGSRGGKRRGLGRCEPTRRSWRARSTTLNFRRVWSTPASSSGTRRISFPRSSPAHACCRPRERSCRNRSDEGRRQRDPERTRRLPGDRCRGSETPIAWNFGMAANRSRPMPACFF